jgi:aspartate dehydrogenase
MSGLPVRIGIIGYGAIGQQITARGLGPKAEHYICAILVKPEYAGAYSQREDLPFVTDVATFLDRHPDLAIECAGSTALRQMGERVLQAGCDIVAASASALVDDALRARLASCARSAGRSLYVPSGAIGAADALAAMRLAGLQSVVYRGIKQPAAWRGSLAESVVDLDRVEVRQRFFQGTAREAAEAFPKNANVAATIGLAGLGLDATTVELFADPAIAGNCHEVEANGVTGGFTFRMLGRPSPDNAKTSALTAYSLVHSALTRSAAIVLR